MRTLKPFVIWCMLNFPIAAFSQVWTALVSPTSNVIFDLYFITADEGYSVGRYGEIFKTTDGGATWETLNSGVNTDLYRVFFTDQQHGFVVGDSGMVLRTDDAGITWEPVVINTTANLREVRFWNAQDGIILGGSANGTVIITTDGGETWTSQSDIPGNGLRCARHDGQNLYFLGWNSAIYKSVFPEPSYEMILILEGNPIGLECLPDGTSVCAGTSGYAMRSDDQWSTWSNTFVDSDYSLGDFAFLDANHGFLEANEIAGIEGRLLETTDAGETWTFADITTSKIFALCPAGNHTAYAGGVDGVLWKYTEPASLLSEADSNAKQINIFPNPTQDELSIHLGDYRSTNGMPVQLVITDLSGKTVNSSQVVSGPVITVSITSYRPGNYSLRIIAGAQVVGYGAFIIE